MRIDIVTIFPEFFEKALEIGPLKRAREKGLVEIRFFNPRDFADNPREVDDYPFGGGPGMVMKPEPLVRAIEAARGESGKVVLLSPAGERFTQKWAETFAHWPHLVLVCGRYKDVDDRVRAFVDMELSIGDYVLSGGEPAALVVLDAVVRLLPGAVGDRDSVTTDSFSRGILDAPYYTRPREFRGLKVPEVLLSGDHERIRLWRKKEALRRTLKRRPDLLEKAELDEEARKLLEEIRREEA